jgi:hypothetical protein
VDALIGSDDSRSEANDPDVDAEGDRLYREAYCAVWPECRPHRAWPNIAYWRIVPERIRYRDYDRGPLVMEFALD